MNGEGADAAATQGWSTGPLPGLAGPSTSGVQRLGTADAAVLQQPLGVADAALLQQLLERTTHVFHCAARWGEAGQGRVGGRKMTFRWV